MKVVCCTLVGISQFLKLWIFKFSNFKFLVRKFDFDLLHVRLKS